ncbi:MAG: trigger factor [Planctomycetes bacterium]|nr:trigger factor [Planctomycetota bacterium]
MSEDRSIPDAAGATAVAATAGASTTASGSPAAAADFDVTVEEAGVCRKKVKVSVSADRVRADVRKSYADLSRNVPVAGFRRGKVPRRLLERRFEERVRDEVKESLVNESFDAAVAQHALRPVAVPSDFVNDVVFNPDGPLTYEIVIEVRPSFKLCDYRGLRLSAPEPAVSEEEVRAALQSVRAHEGVFKPVDDGAKADDQVVVDAVFKEGEVELAREENARFLAGHPHLLGVHPRAGRERFVGAKAGDEFTVEVAFPKSDEEEETESDPGHDAAPDALAGKSGAAAVTVRQVLRLEVPPVDDAWLAERHYTSLEALRENLGNALLEHKDGQRDAALEDQAVKMLAEQISFDLPDSVVQGERERRIARVAARLLEEGVDRDVVRAQAEQEVEAGKADLAVKVRGDYILMEIAEKERIFPLDIEVQHRLALLADRQGVPFETMQQYVEKNDLLPALRSDIRTQKVRRMLRERAVVTVG